MIAAKYRLFSAEPKASKFPRSAHTEEVAVRRFDLGRRAKSPGWSATEKLTIAFSMTSALPVIRMEP